MTGRNAASLAPWLACCLALGAPRDGPGSPGGRPAGDPGRRQVDADAHDPARHGDRRQGAGGGGPTWSCWPRPGSVWATWPRSPRRRRLTAGCSSSRHSPESGRRARGDYALDKVAIGNAVEVNGRVVVVDGENTAGADLGFIGRSVLLENEKILKDEFRQVARTSTMVVFDAKLFVLRGGKHEAMVLRHVVLASSTTGKVSTFVWLLAPDGGNGYALAERGLQKLPAGDAGRSGAERRRQKVHPRHPLERRLRAGEDPPGGSRWGFSEALRVRRGDPPVHRPGRPQARGRAASPLRAGRHPAETRHDGWPVKRAGVLADHFLSYFSRWAHMSRRYSGCSRAAT